MNFSYSDVNEGSFVASGKSPLPIDDSNYVSHDDVINNLNQKQQLSKMTRQQSSNFYEAI